MIITANFAETNLQLPSPTPLFSGIGTLGMAFKFGK
jgi:hypothetical protein